MADEEVANENERSALVSTCSPGLHTQELNLAPRKVGQSRVAQL